MQPCVSCIRLSMREDDTLWRTDPICDLWRTLFLPIFPFLSIPGPRWVSVVYLRLPGQTIDFVPSCFFFWGYRLMYETMRSDARVLAKALL